MFEEIDLTTGEPVLDEFMLTSDSDDVNTIEVVFITNDCKTIADQLQSVELCGGRAKLWARIA